MRTNRGSSKSGGASRSNLSTLSLFRDRSHVNIEFDLIDNDLIAVIINTSVLRNV